MLSAALTRLSSLAFIYLLLQLGDARPTPTFAPRDVFPLPPDTDPFYQPPTGFEHEQPGTILKHRSINAAIFGIIPNPVEAHQLLYRTTAVNGSAITTVTTIFKPFGTTKLDRFISFQTAYDSSAPYCNPSYNYQLGSGQESLVAVAEALVIEVYLALGYVVVSPDYEGPDAAFSVGRLEGMIVLDGMRAVKNYGDVLGFTTQDPKIVGVGYSGGAIGTGWAASTQSAYAPELDVVGWVQGGTPANVTGTFENVDGTIFAGFLPAAVAGFLKPSAYKSQLDPLFNSIVTQRGRDAIDFASKHCVAADIVVFLGTSLLNTDFQSLGDSLLYDPRLSKVLNDNTMGINRDEIPLAPVFMYHAVQDEVIPYADASALATRWCDDGASVKFTTFEAGGHVTTEIVALLDAIAFVTDAFAGDLVPTCSRNTELADALNPIALGVSLEPILTQLANVLVELSGLDLSFIAGSSVA